MHTFNLLEKYLKQNTSRVDVKLTDYTLNGNIIKLKYNYPFTCTSGEIANILDGEIEIELLDYITFVYNLCNNNKQL